METNTTPETPVVAEKKKIHPLLAASIAVFALVVISTGVLFYLNMSTSADLEREKASVLEIDSKISLLRSDSDVRSVELVTANKSLLEKDISKSAVQWTIARLLDLKKIYGVDFSGFSYSEKKLSTVVTVPVDPAEKEPAAKLVKFIADFRDNTGTASGSQMQLGEIHAVSGDPTNRSFAVEFTLK